MSELINQQENSRTNLITQLSTAYDTTLMTTTTAIIFYDFIVN